MSDTKYVTLKGDDSTHEDNELLDGAWQARMRIPWFTRALCSALVASLLFNVCAFAGLFAMRQSAKESTSTAGLSWNTPSTIGYRSPFNDPNRTIEDDAWASSIVDPATLVVALDDSFTESLGVMHSMRWPWDHEKGVYTLNSAHELHCLHLLRKTINQAYDGNALSWPREHSVHCLEYLLQNIMCYADDTLLYQGLIHQNKHAEVPIGGLGDTRVCRSWSRLHAWAREHSACYNPRAGEHDPDFPETDKYKFCPQGERPWEEMR